MCSNRQGLDFYRLISNFFGRLWVVLTLALTVSHTYADSPGGYDPFEIPEGAYEATHVTDTDYTSVITFSGSYNKYLPSGTFNEAARAVVAREFYRTHADDYDFLVVFSDFEFETGDALAFYKGVRNDIQGIGVPQFDLSSLYGSNGRLQGYIDMAAFSRYQLDPLHPDYEYTLTVLAHEVLHRWGVYIRFQDEQGQASDALLGRQDAHWSFFAHTDASVEYGHRWKDLGDGSFAALAAKRFYSPTDLYLMGFNAPEEVPPFFYIESTDREKTELSQPGITVRGIAKTVTIEDIIAVEGPRIPSAADSQKEFKFGFIYLKSPSTPINEDYLLALQRLREAFATRFSILTGGRAIAHVYPQAKSTEQVGEAEIVTGGEVRQAASSVPEALAWLRSVQTTEGYFEDKAGTRTRDTAVSLSTLAAYDPQFTGATKAVNWLGRQAELDNDSLARRLEALPPSADQVRDLQELITRRNADGGWGVKAGFRSDALDTALVLRSIASMAAPDVISSAADYLLNVQGSDGGWAAVENSTSQVAVTALAVDALNRAGVAGEPMAKAAAYLGVHQNQDGGFGASGSTVHDTAQIVLALLRAGHLDSINLAAANRFISNRQSVAGDWDGSVYTTALAVAAIQSANFPNWNVADLTVSPDSVRDGERVQLTTHIVNDGRETAPATVLRVYKGADLQSAVQVSEDIPVPEILPRGSVSVSYYWDSLDQPGENHLIVAVDPANEVDERSELDNSKSVIIQVAQAPAGIDLEVSTGALSITPERPFVLPTTMSISANVRNVGRTDAGEVRVQLYRRDSSAQAPQLIDEQVTNVLGRQTNVVNFVADLTEPGETQFQVIVDPDNVIDEANENNNEATRVIVPQETVDLVVNDSSVSMQPVKAYVNEDVNFTIVLRNQGTLAAAPNTVTYRLRSNGEETVLQTNNIVLGAGETVQHTIPWRVDSPGPKWLIVDVDSANVVSEIAEDNNHYEFAFDAEWLQGTNVSVNHKSIVASPAPLLEGYGATISAEVRNNGTEAVNGLEVSFFNGAPANGGSLIGKTVLGSIAAGSRMPVSVIWDAIPDSSQKHIYVQLDPADLVEEFDESDNVAFETFNVTALPDFAVASGSIVVTPAFPKQGESTNIRVVVNNLGAQAADDIDVALFDADPALGGKLIGNAKIPHIGAFGNTYVDFEYLFDTRVSDVTLYAWVNRAGDVLEKNVNNNIAQRTLVIQNRDFYVTEQFISPDGNGVKDYSRFYFRLIAGETVSVRVKDARGNIIKHFKNSEWNDVHEGFVEWDGRDERGVIVPDGKYDLEVVNTLDKVLGKANIEVDTNRSPLLLASGTPYELVTNVSDIIKSQYPGADNVIYAADDENIFFTQDYYDPVAKEVKNKWLYRANSRGGQASVIFDFKTVPELRNEYIYDLRVSPEVNYITFRPGNSNTIWLMEFDKNNVRELISRQDLTRNVDGEELALNVTEYKSSYDDRWIYFILNKDNYTEVGRVSTVEATGYEILAELPYVLDRSWDSSVWLYPSPASSITYISLESEAHRIFISMDMDSGAYTEVKDMRGDRWNYASISSAGWSSDGNSFAIGKTDGAKVYLYDSAGKETNQFDVSGMGANDDMFVPWLEWHKNGYEIAFAISAHTCGGGVRLEQPGIYIANSSTGNVKKIASVYNSIVPCPVDVDFSTGKGLYASTEDLAPTIIQEDEFVAKPYWVDANGKLWLTSIPYSVAWSPGERRLLISLGGASYDRSDSGLEYSRNYLVAVDVDTGEVEEVLKGWPEDIDGFYVSPTGRRLFINNETSYESLLNLSADVRTLQSRSAGGVSVTGTAVDLNFDYYTLEYAQHDKSDSWLPVSPQSRIPVVDHSLTAWIPPAKGSYYVRLTAYDRAGNSRETISRASWGDHSKITDLYREPGYISPNGDGVQDFVAINMRILEPVNLALEVFNSDNALVRTITHSFDLIGSKQVVVWDGRDDTGARVEDGPYRLVLGKYAYEVVVDSTPPTVNSKIEEFLLPQPCAEDDAEECADVSVNTMASYVFEDDNYYRYRLEARGHQQIAWHIRDEGQFNSNGKVQEFILELTELQFEDNEYRIVVEDLAGNQTTHFLDFSKKMNKAVVLYANDHYVRNLKTGDLDFNLKPSSVPFANYDDVAFRRTSAGLTSVRFRVVETISRPIEKVILQYRPDPSQEANAAWRDQEVTQFVELICDPGLKESCTDSDPKKIYVSTIDRSDAAGEFEFVIDVASLGSATDYEMKIKLLDDLGNAYITNGFRVADAMQWQVVSLDAEEGGYRVKTLMKDIPTSIYEGFLEVKSEQDPRYAKTRRSHSVKYDGKKPLEFVLEDLEPCVEYTMTFVLRSTSGEEYPSRKTELKAGCIDIEYRLEPVGVESCGDDPSGKISISAKIIGISEDRSPIAPEQYQVLMWEMIGDKSENKVLFSVNNPRHSDDYSFDLDINDFAEGMVSLKVSAVAESGAVIEHQVSVPIDQTPPEPLIQFPEAGGKVCAVPMEWVHPSGDTSPFRGSEVNGEIVDERGSALSYEVLYAVGDNSLEPSFLPLEKNASRSLNKLLITNAKTESDEGDAFVRYADSGTFLFGAPAKRSTSGNVNVLGRLGLVPFDKTGEVTLQLKVRDFGTFLQCATQTFSLDASIEGYALNIPYSLISPNGDGVMDSVGIHLDIEEEGFVDVVVRNVVVEKEAKKPGAITYSRVYEKQPVSPGSTVLQWDGTDNGRVLPDGEYFLVVEVRDACGNIETTEKLVEIDTTPPTISIAYPKAGDAMGVNVEVVGSVNDSHLDNYSLSYFSSDNDNAIPIAHERVGRHEAVLGKWNTFGLVGNGELRLKAQDHAGNQSVVIVPLTLAERTNLISYLDYDSTYLSPNGDGRQDSFSARVGLIEPVLLDVFLIDGNGSRVAQLGANLEALQGEYIYVWDGTVAQQVATEGTYTLELVAKSKANPLFSQTESLKLTVDVTPPNVTVSGIDGGFAVGASITASMSDTNFGSFSYSITEDPASSDWKTMLEGDRPGSNILLQMLDPDSTEEGNKGLRLEVFDLAGNKADVTIGYMVDFSPPAVEVVEPAVNAIYGTNSGPLNVTGSVSDLNFTGYRILYNASGNEVELGSFDREVEGSLGSFAIADLPEGDVVLIVEAEDKAKQRTRVVVPLIIDKTPPQLAWIDPVDGGYVTGVKPLLGTAVDPRLSEYRIEFASGHDINEQTSWTHLIFGGTSVTSGPLAYWSDLPPDGKYALRLSGTDSAGNTTSLVNNITLDTVPPEAPVIESLSADKQSGVEITWSEPVSSDVAGYIIKRSGRSLQSELIVGTTYHDLLTSEGMYQYQVIAVDQAGNHSQPSLEKTLRIDWTPPKVMLANPKDGQVLSGLVGVRGTAHSEDDFQEYRISVGIGEEPVTWQQIIRSNLSLLGAELAQWNTLELQDSDDYILKLEAEDVNGNVATTQVRVSVDNSAPSAPTGLVATVSGRSVTLAWDPNTENDLAGYLLFVDGRLINSEGPVVGDLSPYILSATSFLEANKGDGRYEYAVFAIDQAGNVSDSSESISAVIETRAPHVSFVKPLINGQFENSLYIEGESEDHDLAEVSYQYRVAGTAEWQPIGKANGSGPYSYTWDTTSLPYGSYEIRALSVDVNGNEDSAPELRRISKVDLTRPAQVTGLAARVTGGDAQLDWTANSDADVAGYHVERRLGAGNYIRRTSQPVSVTQYVDQGLADGRYEYRIVAIDQAGNEAEASEPVVTNVYTADVVPPYSPTSEDKVAILGTGPVGAVAEISVENILGSQDVVFVTVSEDGTFRLDDVVLQPGDNLVSVTLEDEQSNRSKSVQYRVVKAEVPATPREFRLSAEGETVGMIWAESPESNVVGYRVFGAEGAALNAEQRAYITHAQGIGTSYGSYGPYRAIDNNTSTYFRGVYNDRLTLTLDKMAYVSRVEIVRRSSWSMLENFDVEVWTGAYWLPLITSANAYDALIFDRPYFTDKVRFSFSHAVEVSEVRVFHSPLITTTSFQAVDQGNGEKEYTVTAVNNLGLESEPAEPETVAVGDVTPPEPVRLSGDVVDGHDVLLSWEPSTSADAVSYRVYRNGEIIQSVGADVTQVHDERLLNGTYVYTVKTMDAVGNLSLPSNAVSVEVALALPASPSNLVVQAIPEGERLRLSWQMADEPASPFRVLRSESAGGPYELVATSWDTTYLDRALTNGTRYFYVVQTVDKIGNVSLSSNEASGIPADTSPPLSPQFTGPVRSGSTGIVEQSPVTLTGRAEPGAKVTMIQDGVVGATVTAVHESQLLAYIPDVQGSASPTQKYIFANDYYNGEAFVRSLESGEIIWTLPTQKAVVEVTWLDSDTQAVIILFDGYGTPDVYLADIDNEALVKLAVSADESDFVFLSRYVATARKVLLLAFSMMDDRGQAYFLSLDTGAVDAVVDLGDLSSFGYMNPETFALSPDGHYAAWIDDSNVYLMDMETGAVEIAASDAQPDFNRLSWKSDGRGFLYVVGQIEESSSIAFFDMHARTSTLLVDQGQEPQVVLNPSWSSDKHFTFFRLEAATEMLRVVERDVETGRESVLVNDLSSMLPRIWDIESIQYLPSNGLVSYVDYNDAFRLLAPAGQFSIENVFLANGENEILAIAEDEAGNVSDVSDPAVIVYSLENRADLAVKMAVTPSVSIMGTSSQVQIEVSNVGKQLADASTLSVDVIGPEGNVVSLLDKQRLEPTLVGTTQLIAIGWNVPSVSGVYHLIATVDEQNQIAEQSERNNVHILEVPVLAAGQLAMETVLNQTGLGRAQELKAAVTLFNPMSRVDGLLTVSVVDEKGYPVVAMVEGRSVSVPSGGLQKWVYDWNSGSTYAGDYAVVARLTDAQGKELASTRSPFVIGREFNAVLSLTTDRSSYRANTDVHLVTRIGNVLANAALTDVVLWTTIKDANGTEVFSQSSPVGEINPGDTQNVSFTWNTGVTPPGVYTTTSILKAGELELAQAINNFTVKPDKPSLTAVINLSEAEVPAGAAILPNYMVTNNGNARVEGINLSLTFDRIESSSVIGVEGAEIGLDSSATFQGTAVFLTDSLPIGNYRLQLISSYTFEGVEYREILATQFLRLIDTVAPTVSILNPVAGATMNAKAAKAVIFAEDSLSGVASIEIRVNQGNWVKLLMGAVNVAYDLSELLEGTHTVSARATDLAGNVSDPVTVSFAIDNSAPQVYVEGVEEGVHYRSSVKPTVRFENATQTKVELDGAPYNAGTPITAEGPHRLEVYAVDDAGNDSRVVVHFTLDYTAPVITVEGVQDQALYTVAVVPTFRVEEANPGQVVALLNGQPFESGNLIEAEGKYELTVTAHDKAGNTQHVSYVFTIDRTAPDAPLVESPIDGEVVEARTLTVNGTAEPGSVIELAFNEAVHSTVADDVGHFSFSDLSAEPGAYQLVLTATDRAGNRSTETTLGVTVRSKLQVEVTGSVTPRARVLIWIPEAWIFEPHAEEFDQLIGLIGSTYQMGQVDYNLVRNEGDFVRALRSQRYNVLLVGSLSPALGHPLYMSYNTEQEIRAVVGAGTGLVWINNHANLFELWRDMIGARSLISMPHIANVHLDQSPATPSGSWEFAGRHAVRVALTGGIGVGQLETACSPHWHLLKYYKDCSFGWWHHHSDHKNPAMVINKYGAGSVVLFTFNPNDLQDKDAARSILMQATTYATPVTADSRTTGVVDVNWHVTSADVPLNLAAVQQTSDGLSVLHAAGGETVDPRTARWTRAMNSPDALLTSQVRLTGEPGTYKATVELYDTVVGAGTLLAEGELDIHIQQSQTAVELGYMNALDRIDYSLFEYWDIHMATVYAQAALSLDSNRIDHVELAIAKVKASLTHLNGVSRQKTGDAIIQGGRLLQYYQGLWFKLKQH